MSRTKCSNCGLINPPDLARCRRCGAPVSTDPYGAPPAYAAAPQPHSRLPMSGLQPGEVVLREEVMLSNAGSKLTQQSNKLTYGRLVLTSRRLLFLSSGKKPGFFDVMRYHGLLFYMLYRHMKKTREASIGNLDMQALYNAGSWQFDLTALTSCRLADSFWSGSYIRISGGGGFEHCLSSRDLKRPEMLELTRQIAAGAPQLGTAGYGNLEEEKRSFIIRWRVPIRVALVLVLAIAGVFVKLWVDRPERAERYNRLGNIQYQQDNLDRAISYYTKASELDPASADPWRNRGIAFYRKKMYDAAISDLTKALAIDNNDFNAHYTRGMSYLWKENAAEALIDFDEALRLSPSDVDAHYGRGLALKMMKDRRAIESFNKVLSLSSDESLKDRARKHMSELTR